MLHLFTGFSEERHAREVLNHSIEIFSAISQLLCFAFFVIKFLYFILIRYKLAKRAYFNFLCSKVYPMVSAMGRDNPSDELRLFVSMFLNFQLGYSHQYLYRISPMASSRNRHPENLDHWSRRLDCSNPHRVHQELRFSNLFYDFKKFQSSKIILKFNILS